MVDLTNFYKRLWSAAAQTVCARFSEIDNGLWRVERGKHVTLIHNYIVQLDDPVTLNMAGDKALCHRLLQAEGLMVPEHDVYTIQQLEKVDAFVARHPGSRFVVKPAAGTSGARGVTTHLQTVKECRRASVLASLYGEQILIERWSAGESYRLLFLDGEMIHASRRKGRRIAGDGRSTVRELLVAESPLPARSPVSRQSERDIAATLEAQGLGLESVPEAGRRFLVESARMRPASHREVRTVFDEDATDEIGPALRQQAARAVRALGSRFAGVDVITLDPALPLERAGGVINEINTTPGLHHHSGLDGGHGVPPAVRVLDRLLSAESNLGGAADDVR